MRKHVSMWLCWMQFYCSALNLVQIKGCSSVEACVCVCVRLLIYFFICVFLCAGGVQDPAVDVPQTLQRDVAGRQDCHSGWRWKLLFLWNPLEPHTRRLGYLPVSGSCALRRPSFLSASLNTWLMRGGGGGERGRVIYLFITSHSSWSYSTCCISLLQWMCMVLSLTETFIFRWMQQDGKQIRGVHRDFVIVSRLTHQASEQWGTQTVS